MNESIGAWLIGIGAALVVIGALAWSGALGWFGRLPGDIAIERDNVRVYIPITSMIVVSIALSALLWLIRRLWG